MTTLIKKISIKTVCNTPEKEVIGNDAEGKPIIGIVERDLMQIIGVATHTRVGTTTYGDFIGFRGQFQATNLKDGKVYRSSQCFMPDDVTSMIAAELSQEGTKSVEFAFIVGVKARPDLKIGYEYTSKPLLEPSENDPLKNLMARLPSKDAPKMLEKEPVTKDSTKPVARSGKR